MAKRACTPPQQAQAENTEKLLDLIKESLPKNETKAIRLRYSKNYDIREVAETLGVKRETVSQYLSTGLKKMRSICSEGRMKDSYKEGDAHHFDPESCQGDPRGRGEALTGEILTACIYAQNDMASIMETRNDNIEI